MNWIAQELGGEIARPQSDIILSVTRWSKLWVWMIQKDGATVARGIADEASDARFDAETAWNNMKGTETLLQIKTPFDRRW